MSYKETSERFMKLSEECKNAKTPEERQEAKRNWWAAVMDEFNTNVAGPMTLADGQKMTIRKVGI